MKGIIGMLALMTFMYFATGIIAAKAQWGFEFRPPEEWSGYGYHRHHSRWRHEGGNCRELRAACMHKEELGEVGQGNCRRYRETCQ